MERKKTTHSTSLCVGFPIVSIIKIFVVSVDIHEIEKLKIQRKVYAPVNVNIQCSEDNK